VLDFASCYVCRKEADMANDVSLEVVVSKILIIRGKKLEIPT